MQGEQAVRTQLQARLDALLKRVGEITDDLRRPGDRDWQERAAELENDEVLETLDESSRAEVAQVRAALRRLDAGTYGRCAKCGEPIGAARLAAIPSTTTCVACARG
ncbi:MAG: TraR/DksA family transcriptional regulator [Acidobacteria bacterium]|nr:TraR/DksA family transcriptional regulator [Acidobacteriota bacterium]